MERLPIISLSLNESAVWGELVFEFCPTLPCLETQLLFPLFLLPLPTIEHFYCV